jgi:predicted RNA-binding protein (virulence factor B family)
MCGRIGREALRTLPDFSFRNIRHLAVDCGMVNIGRRNLLKVVREAPQGLYLDGEELGEILLPRRYVAKDGRTESIDVFIYLDSEDRLVATTEKPLAQVGDFACLKVVSVNRRVGAFLDWGLSKDLLLPFREQPKPVGVGERVVVAVFLDDKTRRIVASARLQRFASRERPTFKAGDRVRLMIAAESPLGYTALIERAHLGLLYRDALPAPLETGRELDGFVKAIRPNGKIDLSLDQAGYKRVAPLKFQILNALKDAGGRLALDDSSPPEAVRERFGVSKNAYKQALGALYKARLIQFPESGGIEFVGDREWTPSAKGKNPRLREA